MGSHYDPNDGAPDRDAERGALAKRKLSSFHDGAVGRELDSIFKLLRGVEKSVLGGEAIDDLRRAARKLDDRTA